VAQSVVTKLQKKG